MKGFLADRMILGGKSLRQALNASNIARLLVSCTEQTAPCDTASLISNLPLQVARRAGVQLQLFDVQADPGERDNLLAVTVHPSRRMNASARDINEVASTMLGHYLSAVRVARKRIERVKEEQRDGHPQGRGYEMVVWFCRRALYFRTKPSHLY